LLRSGSRQSKYQQCRQHDPADGIRENAREEGKQGRHQQNDQQRRNPVEFDFDLVSPAGRIRGQYTCFFIRSFPHKPPAAGGNLLTMRPLRDPDAPNRRLHGDDAHGPTPTPGLFVQQKRYPIPMFSGLAVSPACQVSFRAPRRLDFDQQITHRRY
jgi:hypothetical protein